MYFKHFISAPLIFLSLSLQLSAAPNFSFPHNATYPYGIKPSNIDNSKIQAAYNEFFKQFYVESGDKARIKWDNPDQTVSEGIGYGMLIMVYMDNTSNNTQSKFDKLWNYYNSFLNERGLMNWQINGFSGVAQRNAATDAELDVAVALVQAYKQWGDEKYLNNARNLIAKIYEHEVNENGYLKPGDAWDSKKNPSYLSTAAMESFKNAGTQDWNRVIKTSYTLLKTSRNSTTGLVPDWCAENGGSLGANYGYDAARTPWRIAWGYVWYGHSDAKDFCTKISSWINSKTGGKASSIVDGYSLNGNTTGQWNNSTFVGPFACAAMVDQSHQTWLNNANGRMNSLADESENYYSHSLKLITMLLLSGNMPDLWNESNVETFTLNITSNPSNGGTVQVNSPQKEFQSGSQVSIEAQPANGFQFTSWSGDISGTESNKNITVTKNMNITAHFEPYSGVKTGRESLHSLSLYATNNSITYSVPSAGKVKIQIFNVTGKMISEPVSKYFSGGTSQVMLSKPLNRGFYLIQIESTAGKLTRQMFVTK